MRTVAALPPLTYLNVRTTVASWLLTKDHKRIGLMYMIVVTGAFLIGAVFAALIRLELTTPAGDLVSSDTYNRLFTMHGVMMVFFVLIPAVPAILGNAILPLQLGAKDVAFPKINLLSWYVFVIGFVFTLYALIAGGVDTGWTFYPPYSTQGSPGHVAATGLGVFIAGFSSILTGLNFMVTIHRMRAPGLTWFRLPLFVWALYATSLVQVLGTPVIAITVLMLFLERVAGLGIFNPALGGDPVLFQHLFWFYSHPAVYIMILPPMGAISEVIACFSRKNIFGYSFVAFSSLAIAVFGFLVWAHHLFVAGISPYSAMVFSFLTYAVAIPSAVKTFNWTATLYRGAIWWKAPMMWVLGFMGLFLIGGLTGLFTAALGLDVHIHDTYFVVAHFHYIMVGGAIMGYFAGLHYWWPKMTGRMYNDTLATLSALLVFVGFNLTFFPQFILGYLGMPRRYRMYPPEFQVLNVMSSAGATVLGAGYALCLAYLTYSFFKGAPAGANPWLATGLEWTTQSPPLPENFLVTPVVTEGAYEYSKREIKVVYALAAHADPHGHVHAHHPAHQHHFDTMEQQAEAATLGMWIFLVTEVMFFGGLFMAYLLYRVWYPEAWAEGSRELDIRLGGLNTAVLIGSSLTMAFGVRCAQTGQRKATVKWLLLTMVLGATFLVVKFFEYKHKYELGHIPGANFHFEGIHADQVEIFLSLYFCMTGLHALHMIIGLGLMTMITIMAWKGRFSPEWYTPVEMSGLYWHFVDIVWIFLFPLLYLVDRAGHYA